MDTIVFQAGILGPQQIILIVVVLILLFGAKKIPELMKGVGKGIKEFKDASQDKGEGQKEDQKK
tara:strand:- start:367 stop:558 length:192 start_codon:yes stop_codon:yes gene_type:complete